MMIRGVEKQYSKAVTLALLGEFRVSLAPKGCRNQFGGQPDRRERPLTGGIVRDGSGSTWQTD